MTKSHNAPPPAAPRRHMNTNEKKRKNENKNEIPTIFSRVNVFTAGNPFFFGWGGGNCLELGCIGRGLGARKGLRSAPAIEKKNKQTVFHRKKVAGSIAPLHSLASCIDPIVYIFWLESSTIEGGNNRGEYCKERTKITNVLHQPFLAWVGLISATTPEGLKQEQKKTNRK